MGAGRPESRILERAVCIENGTVDVLTSRIEDGGVMDRDWEMLRSGKNGRC